MPNWADNISATSIERVVRAALTDGALDQQQRAMVFHDTDMLRSRLDLLNTTFPPNTLHAIAIKANPLVRLLREVVNNNCGLETASLEEVYIARAANCPADKIVFDSPVKTVSELEECLSAGYILNVDNFEELKRIDELIKKGAGHGKLGIRINPMVGAGKIAITSVADGASKFGIRIDNERSAILDAFETYPWLSGLHVHIGSQGCDLPILIKGAQEIAGLLSEINTLFGSQRIEFVDIGGGLPAAYQKDDNPPSVEEYVSALKKAAPALFSGSHVLITEFGRSIHAGCSFAVSKVEYTKPYGDHQLAAIHLGADMFMRPVYLPEQWRHRCLVLDSQGQLKTGDQNLYSIGGPLCFAGDLIFRQIKLPTIEPGDYIAIQDTGAYTISMWSRHCSRGIPPVLGYSSENQGIEFSNLFSGETAENVAQFWSR